MYKNRFYFLFILVLLAICINAPESQAQEKLVPFEKDDKWGYMDQKGRIVIEPKFVIAHDFSPEGIAAVADKNGWAYINMAGNVVIRPFVFDNAPDPFNEGLARFSVDNKFGFFDKTGKVIIQPQFDFAWSFSEGLAAMCTGCKEEKDGEYSFMKGGKWGYINKKGEIVIPTKFERASYFENGKAPAKLNGEWLHINKKGEVIKDAHNVRQTH